MTSQDVQSVPCNTVYIFLYAPNILNSAADSSSKNFFPSAFLSWVHKVITFQVGLSDFAYLRQMCHNSGGQGRGNARLERFLYGARDLIQIGVGARLSLRDRNSRAERIPGVGLCLWLYAFYSPLLAPLTSPPSTHPILPATC